MAIQNALNLTSTGIVTHDGAGVFTGSTVTEGGVLLGGAANSVVDTGVLAKGTTIVGDGALAPTLLAVGTDGQILEADSTEASGVKWATPTTSGTPSPVTVNTLNHFTDFVPDPRADFPFWITGAVRSTSGNSNKDTPGVLEFQSSDSVVLHTPSDAGAGYFIGGGEITMIFRGVLNGSVPVGAGDIAFFGMGDGTIGVPTANRVGLIFDPALGNQNWHITTANTSVVTNTDTGVAMTNAGNWQIFKIVINAAGTSAEFFINGVSLGTQSTNFPATTTPMRAGFMQLNFPVPYDLDYMGFNQVLTSDRS